VAKEWGGIDILVNNAAAFIFGTIEEVSSEDWDKILSVNVKVL
jgi:NAD(P)-dependent dehydrogenase (short-subunit alcohol dehydrogenase family)